MMRWIALLFHDTARSDFKPFIFLFPAYAQPLLNLNGYKSYDINGISIWEWSEHRMIGTERPRG